MRETAQERINNASNLLDVLLVLEDKILKDTHVSTLAYINKEVTAFDENKGYGIYEVKPFPLVSGQDPFTLYAYSLGGNYVEKDIVFVVFADRNFIASLDIERGNQKPTQDEVYHSLKYGLIVAGGSNYFPPLPTDDKKHNLICKDGKIEWEKND